MFQDEFSQICQYVYAMKTYIIKLIMFPDIFHTKFGTRIVFILKKIWPVLLHIQLQSKRITTPNLLTPTFFIQNKHEFKQFSGHTKNIFCVQNLGRCSVIWKYVVMRYGVVPGCGKSLHMLDCTLFGAKVLPLEGLEPGWRCQLLCHKHPDMSSKSLCAVHHWSSHPPSPIGCWDDAPAIVPSSQQAADCTSPSQLPGQPASQP